MKNRYKFLFELLAIFIGVTAAFYLNNWQEERNKKQATDKILLEIKNGLLQDLEDLKGNAKGHEASIRAAEMYHKLLLGKPVDIDSFGYMAFMFTRDFISIQNRTGYETLKSRGLELIESDSLRRQIIHLYDFDYEVLEKLEEQYDEMQYSRKYSRYFVEVFSPYYVYQNGYLVSIKQPINVTTQQRAELQYYITQIIVNRQYILRTYNDIIARTETLVENIQEEIR